MVFQKKMSLLKKRSYDDYTTTTTTSDTNNTNNTNNNTTTSTIILDFNQKNKRRTIIIPKSNTNTDTDTNATTTTTTSTENSNNTISIISNTTTIVKGKFIHILVNLLKKYSKFVLYNEKGEEIKSIHQFLSSSKFCYTNDSSIKFHSVKESKSPLISLLYCEVSDIISLEKKSQIECNDIHFTISNIEIYFPNYPYSMKNYNLLYSNLVLSLLLTNNSNRYQMNSFYNRMKDYLINKVTPNRIVFTII